jgi:energy-coupling factor transport system substrate-specific component
MVALVALTAAVYAATAVPFKGIQIIPGFTELRPAGVPLHQEWLTKIL